MRRPFFLTVLVGFVANAAGVLHELKPSAFGKVHDLTQATFASFIEQHEKVLVDCKDHSESERNRTNVEVVYAPWCGHCRLLAPKFKEAADYLGEHNIVLAKVDCTEIYFAESDSQWNNTNLCHDINSYPTLRVYHGNASSYEKYEGQRRTAEEYDDNHFHMYLD